MGKLWIFVNKLKLEKSIKNSVFIILSTLLSMLIGGLLWVIAGRFYLSGIGWLLCFMGYPAVFVGLFGGFLYLYNHDFS